MKTLHGVLPDYSIKELIESGVFIKGSSDRVQPASVDLLPDLNTVFNLKRFTVPRRHETVQDLIKELCVQKFAIPHSADKALLEGELYLVKLAESLNDSPFVRASPKSSIGRIFNHTRLVSDKVGIFDEVPQGYKGDLWMLVRPKFSDIILDEREPLNQIRFFVGDARLSEQELRRYIKHHPSVISRGQELFQEPVEVSGASVGEVPISVDLKNTCYRTINSKKPLRLSYRGLDFRNYFEKIPLEELEHGLLIEEGKGYLIGTLEQFQVPENISIEVIVSDKYGEIKLHFAGFVDPGFGLGISNSITLEVVSYEPGYFLRHGQSIGHLRFEHMADIPQKVYKGNYRIQEFGAKLPKYFL